MLLSNNFVNLDMPILLLLRLLVSMKSAVVDSLLSLHLGQLFNLFMELTAPLYLQIDQVCIGVVHVKLLLACSFLEVLLVLLYHFVDIAIPSTDTRVAFLKDSQTFGSIYVIFDESPLCLLQSFWRLWVYTCNIVFRFVYKLRNILVDGLHSIFYLLDFSVLEFLRQLHQLVWSEVFQSMVDKLIHVELLLVDYHLRLSKNWSVLWEFITDIINEFTVFFRVHLHVFLKCQALFGQMVLQVFFDLLLHNTQSISTFLAIIIY